jgi:hypothetical protein
LIDASIRKLFTPTKLPPVELPGYRWTDPMINNRSPFKGLMTYRIGKPTIMSHYQINNGAVEKISRYSSGRQYWKVTLDEDGRAYGMNINGTFDVYDLKPKK